MNTRYLLKYFTVKMYLHREIERTTLVLSLLYKRAADTKWRPSAELRATLSLSREFGMCISFSFAHYTSQLWGADIAVQSRTQAKALSEARRVSELRDILPCRHFLIQGQALWFLLKMSLITISLKFHSLYFECNIFKLFLFTLQYCKI